MTECEFLWFVRRVFSCMLKCIFEGKFLTRSVRYIACIMKVFIVIHIFFKYVYLCLFFMIFEQY